MDGNVEATAGMGQRDCSETQGRWLSVALQPPHQLARPKSRTGDLALPQEGSRENEFSLSRH